MNITKNNLIKIGVSISTLIGISLLFYTLLKNESEDENDEDSSPQIIRRNRNNLAVRRQYTRNTNAEIFEDNQIIDKMACFAMSFLLAEEEEELFNDWKNAYETGFYDVVKDKTLNELIDTETWESDEDLKETLECFIPDFESREIYVYLWTFKKFYNEVLKK
ncbi:hypothetical protein NUSPORA_02105 [Nucleospora cyclopteri]